MAYSEVSDLLTGDLPVAPTVDTQKFVEDAAEEIDSKIGFLYELPLDFVGLPIHERLLLKQINNKLASGRLVLTLDMAGEETALHAYGLRLVTEAMNELMLIANGSVDLSAGRLATTPVTESKAPSLTNRDEESAVDMFEEGVMRPGYSYWNPGAVVPGGAFGTVRGQ